jgi:agmatinase
MLHAVAFPFDAFGSAGTGAGALLLADVLREAIQDADDETEPTRVAAYTDQLEIDESGFDTPAEIVGWRERGRAAFGDGARTGFTIWLAGNHLGVLPVLDAFTPADLVVQLDAHLDCYDLAGTTEELSHGNFLRHLPAKRPKIIHVGSRDLFVTPAATKPYLDRVLTADDCATDFPGVLKTVTAMAAKAKRVWLDLDADAIDPAFAPAVQSPQPFGLTPQQLLTLTLALSTPKLAGVSVSEFDPGRDRTDTTLQLLAWLIERVLLSRVES